MSGIGDRASVQAVTRVNAEQALYEAFEVKHSISQQSSLSSSQFSLFDLESRFFAPTHVLEAGARRGCQGRPSLCAVLTFHRFQAAP